MQNGIHVVGVEGRMKVEDGGKCGVTRPFWLRIVVQHGFPSLSHGVPSRRIPHLRSNRPRLRRGPPNVPHHQLPTQLRFIGSPS